ncbi:hypothetical protein pb186bvf_014612 [Paramecium bursaria]
MIIVLLVTLRMTQKNIIQFQIRLGAIKDKYILLKIKFIISQKRLNLIKENSFREFNYETIKTLFLNQLTSHHKFLQILYQNDKTIYYSNENVIKFISIYILMIHRLQFYTISECSIGFQLEESKNKKVLVLQFIKQIFCRVGTYKSFINLFYFQLHFYNSISLLSFIPFQELNVDNT